MITVNKEIKSDKNILSLLNILKIELWLDTSPAGRFIAVLDIPVVHLKYYLNVKISLINKPVFLGYFIIE